MLASARLSVKALDTGYSRTYGSFMENEYSQTIRASSNGGHFIFAGINVRLILFWVAKWIYDKDNFENW